jgi:hypothetical protein
VAAYLARFKGASRYHTESGLRCYLAWCAGHGLDPLAARRPHVELYIRWMQEIRRFKALHYRGCRCRRRSDPSEPRDVPGIAEDGAGDDWAGAEDHSQRGVARLDRRGQLLPGLPQLGIAVAQVLQELDGEFVAGLGDSTSRRDLLEDAGGLAGTDFLAEAALEASSTPVPRTSRALWPACFCGSQLR